MTASSPKTKTVPRALSVPELQSFFKMDMHPEDNLYSALQIGRLIFLLRGINLRDLLCLTEQSLSQGRIVYRRSKTGKLYNINVHMAALTPLHWLISAEGHKRITKREIENLDTDLTAVKKYVQFRKVMNAHLRRLGKKIGLSTPLTTYVFRYSYANIAKGLGYSRDLIAEALGHEYGNSVTGIYLEMYDSEKLDEMHSRIVETVTGGG